MSGILNQDQTRLPFLLSCLTSVVKRYDAQEFVMAFQIEGWKPGQLEVRRPLVKKALASLDISAEEQVAVNLFAEQSFQRGHRPSMGREGLRMIEQAVAELEAKSPPKSVPARGMPIQAASFQDKIWGVLEECPLLPPRGRGEAEHDWMVRVIKAALDGFFGELRS